MDHKCISCGKCCIDLTTYVNINDVNRWLDDDRVDILSILTWHEIRGRIPPILLHIPKKKHSLQHSILKKYAEPSWIHNPECLFLQNAKCTIYRTRPSACKNFPRGKVDYICPGMINVTISDREIQNMLAKERKKQNLIIFKYREVISDMIKQAKQDVTETQLKKMLTLTKNIQ